ncbi:hypothetical protein D3C78_1688000 [compost metagenome]
MGSGAGAEHRAQPGWIRVVQDLQVLIHDEREGVSKLMPADQDAHCSAFSKLDQPAEHAEHITVAIEYGVGDQDAEGAVR